MKTRETKKEILRALKSDLRTIIPMLQDNNFEGAILLWGTDEIEKCPACHKGVCTCGFTGYLVWNAYKYHLEQIVTLTPKEQIEYIENSL